MSALRLIDYMEPQHIAALSAIRLRDIETLCANALQRSDRVKKFSAPFVGVAPELPGLGDVVIGAESGGVACHVPTLDVENQHVVRQGHEENADR